jgi:hypothetical protein
MPRITRQNLKIGLGLLLVSLFGTFSVQNNFAQEVVDKTIATVSDGSSKPELITYSDLLWQLALEPNAPLSPPTSDDLNRALQTLINLRLFALEAQRLPSADPTKEQINEEIKRILANFKSDADFERRLRLVGFESVDDDNFQKMMRQRVAIEKYIDFRFRSFVIVTPDEEKKYYQEVFTPDFRRRNPGVLLPSFEEARAQIHRTLEEEKVATDIDRFLDNARQRAEIVILFEV